MNTPWAILLCKFNDDDSEPFAREFYERLFTAAGIGTQNMVDYFRDVSHGNIDTSGSQVFGWLTLNKARREYTGSGPNWQGRQELVDWARQAAMAAGADLSRFYGVVVCMNVATDLFGGGGRQAVCDNFSMQPSLLGQEMGHGYGLDHSRADGSDDDYQDLWDTMSTANAYMARHPEYEQIGPGLNAWNMRGRGWLNEARVWKGSEHGYDVTIELRPLTRTDLSGFLAAELGNGFLVEFRVQEGWDAAIPQPAVLVHRFRDNHSYIMRGTRGQQDLVAGDSFEVGSSAALFGPYTRLEVVSIDAQTRVAAVRLQHRPAQRPPHEVIGGTILGGVSVDGGGVIIVGGHVIPVPPWDPMLKILEQIALYRASEVATQSWSRDAIRREALTAISEHIETLAEELNPFHSPPVKVRSDM